MIAILEAHRARLLGRAHWMPNLLAGLTVGVVALPLAMAFAIASGARPEQGLYTAIVAGLVVTLAGGSRFQIAGPTGAFVVILAGVTAEHGIAGLQVATMMAGVLLAVMGLFRLGGVIRFIPAQVLVGFTAGIGVVIFVGQWRYFLGLPAGGGEAIHERVIATALALPSAHLPTIGIGALTLAALLVAPRVRALKRMPGPLVAMLVGTAAHVASGSAGVATIGTTFGGIPLGLPAFALPELPAAAVTALIGPAFTIAMLGAIESLLSAAVADGMAGTTHDSNQELVGQGIANVLAPLFGGFAATGAIARTATNINTGATGPLAGVVHALTLVAILLLLAPLAAHIPLASLAAILFVVAWNMSELRHVRALLRRAPTADRAILVITFLLTVFADLVVAVNVGVTLSILQFLRRMADSVEVRPADAVDLQTRLADAGLASLPAGLVVYQVEGPLFFGAIENFERGLLKAEGGVRVVILRLGRSPFMDLTGLEALADVLAELRGRGIEVLLCEANGRVRDKLARIGLLGTATEPRHADDVAGAIGLALPLLARAEPTA